MGVVHALRGRLDPASKHLPCPEPAIVARLARRTLAGGPPHAWEEF